MPCNKTSGAREAIDCVIEGSTEWNIQGVFRVNDPPEPTCQRFPTSNAVCLERPESCETARVHDGIKVASVASILVGYRDDFV